ncbi:MAG: leucine--tRNA ligase [Gammaproteobacteria bacterium]|nr:leucine--tRNA ligase [Gammaproteobacteria bacterium]
MTNPTATLDERYDPSAIEPAVQQRWRDEKVFEVREDPAREKFYCLSMFPYPSGRLHMGHVRNYTIGDVISRYQRMQGRNVLQPMGWDAFGLPAENAAIERGVPPAKWTRENIAYMRGQLQRLGFGYDWTREIATCDADYYRWEQWFFGQLLEKGLVYKKQATVNWDPIDQTVLANEQVIDGRGWRSGALVERRDIPQWFVRITAYADELLDDLDKLDEWPEPVKTMQRNWIGRSQGLQLRFPLIDHDGELEVYTTRPDTLLGVTCMAVSAEHPLAQLASAGNPALAAFCADCRMNSVAEAVVETAEKKGMPLGINVRHPLTGATIPVWAANFVLMGYGTGAVMSVPAHDQRDYEFAQAHGLPVRQVIAPAAGENCDLAAAAFTEYGVLINSGEFDGLTSAAAFDAIADRAEQQGFGSRKVQYRLRDWLVSRQRYWGCPIPVVYGEDGEPIAETADRLPVRLPDQVDFAGIGSPLKQMASFYETTLPGTATPARRETDTFDTFMESSWYAQRFCCADLQDGMLDQRANYWMPVDQYIGGIEHAVLHLLYARFFHKLLRDAGLVQSDEPFKRLLTQGMVCAETYFRRADTGKLTWYSPADVDVDTDDKGRVTGARLRADGQPVEVGGVEKMSKSKNNGVDPQHLIERYGADTVRLYTMAAAPPDQRLEWSDSAVEGAARFLRRVWRLAHDHLARGPVIAATIPADGPLGDLRRRIHETIAKVSDDVSRRYKFNTAIAAVMELFNALSSLDDTSPAGRSVLQEGLEVISLLLAPITPHIAEVMWAALRPGDKPVTEAGWPTVDETALTRTSIEVVVQVNGKKRAVLQLPVDADAATAQRLALADENVQRFTADGTVRKVVYVKGKLVNIVVG